MGKQRLREHIEANGGEETLSISLGFCLDLESMHPASQYQINNVIDPLPVQGYPCHFLSDGTSS